MKRLLSVLLASSPALALASPPRPHATGWPLELSVPDAGVYRVVLDRDVYRAATLPSLGDVDVWDAAGASVPAVISSPEQPLAQAPAQVAVPWFPLPRGPAAGASDVTLISERDADGRVRRVETHVAAHGDDTVGAPANAWLVDASQVRGRVVALRLEWPEQAPAFDALYRVEGSDDLRQWRTVQPRVQVLALTRDGQHLRQGRVPLDGAARYLRLLPLRPTDALPLTGVVAEVVTPVAEADWQWERLRGRPSSDAEGATYELALDGRFPVARVDVEVAGNAAGEWTLESRDALDAPWRPRAGPWVAFQVDGGGAEERSAPRSLPTVVRDRYWRLSSSTPAGAVTLRLGYQPEVLVFVASGAPPYTLVAGSPRSPRADAPVAQLVDAMRARRGPSWQPAMATLGEAHQVAARAPAPTEPPPRDWKTWLLWGALVLGSIAVAAFGASLVRRQPRP